MRLILLISVSAVRILLADDWPQAFGPNGDFTVDGSAVDSFSVSMDNNIRRISLLFLQLD